MDPNLPPTPPLPPLPQSSVPPEIPSIRPPSPIVVPGAGGPPSKPIPKKNKKLFAGIAGLIVLISTIGFGIYFGILRPQELRKQAFDTDFQGPCCDQNGCYTYNNGCSTSGYPYPDFWVNRYHCPDTTGGACSDAQYLVETAVPSATFQEDCGIEQIDIGGVSGGTNMFSSRNYDNICSPEPTPTSPPPAVTPTPAATPIPTPPGRPDYCASASINPTNLLPGQTTVFSSTSNTPVNYFTYALYNRDNDGPGNPKPLCVTEGGDVFGQGTCPAGSYQLIFLDPSLSLRTAGSRTVYYEDTFVPDQNNGGQIASRIQMNAYFRLEGGLTPLPDPDCVAYVASASIPTPTAAPPTLTPVPTSPPTATPTLPPGVIAQCVSLIAKKQDANGIWQTINPTVDARPGDIIKFVVGGSLNSGSFTRAAFFINNGQPILDNTPIDGFSTVYTIASAGQLDVGAVLYHSTEGWVD